MNYVCGNCGTNINSEKGYHHNRGFDFIYICHHCGVPTYINRDGEQQPGVEYGELVNNIDDEGVSALYNEARACISVNGYTAAILACRKLLMHVAVAQGAEEGKTFAQYVKYLSDEHIIPINSKAWVDKIRTKGNEANHEIVIMKKDEALELIDFSAMLLKLVYDYPHRVKNPVGGDAESSVA